MRISSDSGSRNAEDDRVLSGRKRLRNVTEGLTVCEMGGAEEGDITCCSRVR